MSDYRREKTDRGGPTPQGALATFDHRFPQKGISRSRENTSKITVLTPRPKITLPN